MVLNGTANDNRSKASIQRKYVPLVKRSSKGKKMLLTYKALKYVKIKHKVFRKYKDSNYPAV